LNGILETCLYVDDLAAAEQFYRTVVGLNLVGRQDGRHVFFRCGAGMLLIFNPAKTRDADSDIPQHGAYGPSHVAFAVDQVDMERWRERLEAHGVEIERIVDWPHGGRSLYFRDPAGNSLELASPQIWEHVG
jgi:catechol 2,3-dioxygenase-like lactoylglutathione lyase family enzyme